MLSSQLRWLVHLVRGRIPPFGGFLGMHNWEENPRVESECAGEIICLVCPGNTSGSPSRKWKVWLLSLLPHNGRRWMDIEFAVK